MAHTNLTPRLPVIALVMLPVALGMLLIMAACGHARAIGDKFCDVTIDGKKFHLEMALDGQTRFHGLSDRKEIPADGGMLFVFQSPVTTSFVMRDCPIPIDIIFIDGAGHVVATHKMAAEPPRAPDEVALNERGVNDKYEDRLKKYPSGFAAQFAIELKGNTLDTIKVKKTDKIDLDIVELKKRAQP